MKDVNPPAIVKADQSAIDQLVFEITATVEIGDRHSKQGSEAYRQAGALLLKLKESVPHGKWGTELARTKVHERRAQRWMKLAKTDAASDLDDQWKIICGHGEQSELTASPTPQVQAPKPLNSNFCERCNRMGRPVDNCQACKELRASKKGTGKAPSKPPAASEPPKEEELPETEEARDLSDHTPPPKPSQKFDWKSFEQSYGSLVRSVDKFAKAYDCRTDPRVRMLLNLASDFLKTWGELTIAVGAEEPE